MNDSSLIIDEWNKDNRIPTVEYMLPSTFMNHFHKLTRRRPFLAAASGGLGALTAGAAFMEYQSDNDPTVSLPRHYNADSIDSYWKNKPIAVARRLTTILIELTPVIWAFYRDFKLFPLVDRSGDHTNLPFTREEIEIQHQQSKQLRQALTRLGPLFIKLGQQLSIRPDLVPPSSLKELQRLCDSVEPVSDVIALQTIRDDLGNEILSQFSELKLVASASLGQVYKARIKETGKEVAIKVQRPDMIRNVSLDLFLLRSYGRFVDRVCNIFTKQVAYHESFMENFSRGSYLELDYQLEAENQRFFRQEFQKRKSKVHVPLVYPKFSSRRVITTEWINGVKLADASKERIRHLIPIGVELFLTQLLDIGVFHADPHPGNLYVMENGTLCLLDFGLIAEIDIKQRNAMTKALFHLLTGNYDELISKDAKELGFLPTDLDTTELKPILIKILTAGLIESGSNIVDRRRKLMSISEELNEVFFRYPFSVPPFFALVTRGLGLLEGIALSGDPDFDIFQASYPYAKRRAAKILGSHSLRRLGL